jgi:hypothetical protein
MQDEINEIKKRENVTRKDLDEYLGILIAEKFVLDRDDEVA